MKEATFDPARELTLYFRCNRNGSKDFVFLYSDGTPYSFIYEEFQLNIYQYQGEKKVFLNLLAVSNQNVLTIQITKSQSNINEAEYYYELYNVQTEETWLCGDAIFHNGKFDGVNSDDSDITINISGQDIDITVEATPSSSTLSYIPENVANKDASGGYVGLTLLKINFKNVLNTFTSFFTNSNTAARTYTFQNRNGTIADDTDLALKQSLINSAVALTDASTIDLTAIKHTLATSSATRTFTISYTGDDITIVVTLNATASVFTFPATSLCVSEGTASGDNTCSISGVSGDKYVIAVKKEGSNYYVVCKNFGQ